MTNILKDTCTLLDEQDRQGAIDSGVIPMPDRPGWVWCRTLDNFGDDTWVMVRPSQVKEAI